MTYQDIPGWCDFESAYDEAVASFVGGLFVEVGCYLGKSLCYLGQKVKESGKPITVIGVDHCLGSGCEAGTNHHAEAIARGNGSLAGQLHANIVACGLSDVVKLFVMPSKMAATFFDNKSIEMVFLDGGHDYESVAEDIKSWLPKVRYGGWLGGDDLCPVWPGVEKAVTELLPGYEKWSHDSWRYKVPKKTAVIQR